MTNKRVLILTSGFWIMIGDFFHSIRHLGKQVLTCGRTLRFGTSMGTNRG